MQRDLAGYRQGPLRFRRQDSLEQAGDPPVAGKGQRGGGLVNSVSCSELGHGQFDDPVVALDSRLAAMA